MFLLVSQSKGEQALTLPMEVNKEAYCPKGHWQLFCDYEEKHS